MTQEQDEHARELARLKDRYAELTGLQTQMYAQAKKAMSENQQMREQVAKMKNILADKFSHTPRNLKKRFYSMALTAAEYMDSIGVEQRSVALHGGRILRVAIEPEESGEQYGEVSRKAAQESSDPNDFIGKDDLADDHKE